MTEEWNKGSENSIGILFCWISGQFKTLRNKQHFGVKIRFCRLCSRAYTLQNIMQKLANKISI
jgi:hypothetical protein